ncbi:MAG: aspartate--tRNA(Asn) ligase, partial [Myxococcales bacterium]|nr:aspartate--tRNA(Asn) ligase [Myxococcales bacterium]
MNEPRIRTPRVREHVGERIAIAGWVLALRRMGKMAFVVVRDGWGTVQVVASKRSLAPLEEAQAGPESVIRVVGRVVANPAAPGGVELVEPEFEVQVAVTEPLPVELTKQLRTARLPDQLDHAPTVLREPSRRAIFELSAGVMAGFRRTLGARGFTEIQTPKLVGAATESGANVFAIDYFGRPAYLAQSPQLYKQIMVGVFERVFEVGPVFRAEPHATVRHLAEYVSLDVELGFIEDHLDVVAVLEAVLAGIVEELWNNHEAAVQRLELSRPAVPVPLPRIDFAQARRRLAEAGVGPREADDLAPAEERWLGAWAQAEHGSDWLVVTGYPMAKRPFYT